MPGFKSIFQEGLDGARKVIKVGALSGLAGAGLLVGTEKAVADNPQSIINSTSENINQESANENEEDEKNVYSYGPRYDSIIRQNKEAQALKMAGKLEINVNNDDKKIEPESYDLRKVAQPALVLLHGLNEKKSANENMAKKFMEEHLKRAQAFDEYNNLINLINSIKAEILEFQEDKVNGRGTIPGYDSPYNDLITKATLKLKQAEIALDKNKNDREKIYNLKFDNIILGDKYQRYIDLAPKIFSEVERARTEAKLLIGGESYLKKLQAEFQCSLLEARHHQEVRLSNIDFVNYEFLSKAEMDSINREAGASDCLAFMVTNSNFIVLPFDLDTIEDQDNKPSFFELALHEFLHSATNADDGISMLAKKILSELSFEAVEMADKDDERRQNAMFSEPSERYTRFKALESDLAKNGIKEIGGDFTLEHYKKMMELYDNEKLSESAWSFIYFTKKIISDEERSYQVFKKLFDQVAFINNPRDYKHDVWNYEKTINQA